MNIFNYIERLKKLNPSEEEPVKRNLDDSLVEQFQSAFTIVPNREQVNSKDESNAIISLVENWDTGNFSVFNFKFNKTLESAQNYILFGECEADSLAIHKPSGEIFMIAYFDLLIPLGIEEGEEEEISHLTPASINQESFLEGLYHAVELNSLVFKGEVDWNNDTDVKRKYAEKAIEKAGGEKYEQFWCTLLDC